MNPFSSVHHWNCLHSVHLRIFTHFSKALQPFDTHYGSHTHMRTLSRCQMKKHLHHWQDDGSVCVVEIKALHNDCHPLTTLHISVSYKAAYTHSHIHMYWSCGIRLELYQRHMEDAEYRKTNVTGVTE